MRGVPTQTQRPLVVPVRDGTDHLRVLIANERQDRLALVGAIVGGIVGFLVGAFFKQRDPAAR